MDQFTNTVQYSTVHHIHHVINKSGGLFGFILILGVNKKKKIKKKVMKGTWYEINVQVYEN